MTSSDLDPEAGAAVNWSEARSVQGHGPADPASRRMQAQLALQCEVAGILAAATSLDEALPPVLTSVCEHLGSDIGAYWGVDADGERLRCHAFSQGEGPGPEAFRAISLGIAFAPGMGLPGRIWASGEPALVHDLALDADFLRAPMAAAAGLRSAIGFPVTTPAGIHGVVECFGRASGDLDEDALSGLTALGALLGQFVERAQAEAARRETEARRISMLESALRASEERLRTVVAHAPVVIFAVDRDGIFTLSEGAGLAALGIQPGQHVGQSYFALYSHLPDSTATMRRALAGEHATTIERYKGLVFETRLVPVRDAGGGVSGVIGVSSEITERARLDEERQRLEGRTHLALDALLAMADAVVRSPSADGSRAPVEAVALRLCTLTRDVLDCRSVSAIAITTGDALRPLASVGLSPEQTEQWYRRIADWPVGTPLARALIARLRAGEAVQIDTGRPELREMANPFGIDRYVLAPMRVGTALVGLLALDYGPDSGRRPDDAALVEGVAGLAALVLERERLQREREEARGSALALREANRRMDEFLGIAGHEMRTPLTSVMGNVQLARRRLHASLNPRWAGAQEGGRAADPARLRSAVELLERAERQVVVLNRLVEDLLDVSRIRSGKLELRPAPCDLTAIVREAIEEQRLAQPDRAILLEPPDAAPCQAVGDAGRLGQVVTNYLSNALKYSAAHQPVVARLECGEREAKISVRDRGPGIPVSEQELIWERFHQVPGVEVQSGSGVGLGMGLHICRTIVEQHGGQVGVDSSPGEGSTFWFTLPRSP